MAWKIEWEAQAVKQVQKLDNQLKKEVARYIKKRIEATGDPRKFGKPLSYDKHGLWRYRIGKVRIICMIHNEELTVLIIRIGQIDTVYNF